MTQSLFSSVSTVSLPLRVGIVGTGYAAKMRATALKGDERSQLVAIAGHTPASTIALSQEFDVTVSASWVDLVDRPDLDLVMICTINRDHGAIARRALEQGKHVVVEYPLSLDPQEAEFLITLAQEKNKLLHVEHIELLGGLHNAIKASLAAIGQVFYVRYVTVNPEHPAPAKWTYQPSLFGFPLSGALSRLHRFTDLFGTVASVNCQTQYWDIEPDLYKACLCNARLTFNNGILGESVYGKGEVFWQSDNTFTLYGEQGTLIFTPEKGQLIQNDRIQNIEVGSRRGLFVKDTEMVLDCLYQGTPLYVTPEASLYTLKVADVARQSSLSGETVKIPS
ncbi:Oxidoreductase-like [Planktothrix serta PCC 8927]|uniref:Oxidoreductase-like n=1 Tax=Planktothrix serta PCC 8927 TaxID=671068 RepID=A0A7Z9BMK2_9CYAN|nr:Gfo/Idh/MocA family oxidoreductase [Planktothrix serta]VXD17701.1 Oxidoreductase-like [Planktothrix serta PCC 8927]